MKKFIVSYSLPYYHRVSVGVTAEDSDEAIRLAQTAFDDGEIWDDTEAMPLLYDDYEEMDGSVLAFEAEPTNDEFKRDGSVDYLQQRNMAMQACLALVTAYDEGEATGGSVPWEGVDEAFRLAWLAMGRKEKSGA